MEYLIGAAITMIAYIVTNRLARSKIKEKSISEIKYSQSHVYSLMKPFMEYAYLVDVPSDTQSTNYLKQAYIKVMIIKNKAYWIKNNTFFVADVINGVVQKETTKEVDTMSMDKVELNEMLFIVEKLREESDDYRGSGK